MTRSLPIFPANLVFFVCLFLFCGGGGGVCFIDARSHYVTQSCLALFCMGQAGLNCPNFC